MIPFRKPNPDGSLSNDFIPGTTWNDINSLYRFDRKLRLLVFDAIERIEIALRTNGKTGKTLDVYADIQGHIKEQLTANRKVTFIKHYLSKYDDPPTPPSWMSVELLYFSELSKICQNLKSRKAAYLGGVFNFIHHLFPPAQLSDVSRAPVLTPQAPFRQSRRCNYLFKYLLISAN